MKTTVRYFNRATFLTIITVGLAGLQCYLLHIGTTDYAHNILSVYFIVELFILLLAIFTGFKNGIFPIIYFMAFLFEATWFFISEQPISPDNFIMIFIGALRIYIFYWLTKQMVKNE
ncbi:MAG TPA: hypothetical protein VD908_06820 [Cytophagales bacterium]|nr:hypothetical protein [Cytophagales bacterium]